MFERVSLFFVAHAFISLSAMNAWTVLLQALLRAVATLHSLRQIVKLKARMMRRGEQQQKMRSPIHSFGVMDDVMVVIAWHIPCTIPAFEYASFAS